MPAMSDFSAYPERMENRWAAVVFALFAALCLTGGAGHAAAQPNDEPPTPIDTPAPQGEPLSARFINLIAHERFGVAKTIVLRFAKPVQRRKAAVSGLSVTVRGVEKQPVGAWGWLDRRTVAYRPKKWWPENKTVIVTADLADVIVRVDRNGRIYTGGTHRRQFRIGRNFVMTVNDAKHTLTVKQDGKVRRSIPVSLGQRNWETRSGVKVLDGEKYAQLQMYGDFPARGVQWDVLAPYSVRLTPGGEFIHGAPWATHRLGKYNGSRGCTNVSVKHAKWLYQRVLPGDPVITKGTGRPLTKKTGNRESWPWNVPWKKWAR
jgi:lipoprotein-anchoring transpeptidase ErfK/SrfK